MDLGRDTDCAFLLCFGRDVGNVVEALYGDLPPPIMLIGHSMGGAIAVHTAVANLVPSLLGLCMIDVVEGECVSPWMGYLSPWMGYLSSWVWFCPLG